MILPPPTEKQRDDFLSQRLLAQTDTREPIRRTPKEPHHAEPLDPSPKQRCDVVKAGNLLRGPSQRGRKKNFSPKRHGAAADKSQGHCRHRSQRDLGSPCRTSSASPGRAEAGSGGGGGGGVSLCMSVTEPHQTKPRGKKRLTIPPSSSTSSFLATTVCVIENLVSN